VKSLSGIKDSLLDLIVSIIDLEMRADDWLILTLIGPVDDDRFTEKLLERVVHPYVRKQIIEELSWKNRLRDTHDGITNTENLPGAILEDTSTLILHLGCDDVNMRWRAAKKLGAHQSDLAREALLSALNDESYFVRRNAAESLGKIGGSEIVPALITLTKDKSSGVRLRAVTELCRSNDKRSTEALIWALRDNYRMVREQAAIGLGKLGNNKAVVPLIVATDDPEEHVQVEATRALGRLDSLSFGKGLVHALRHSNKVVRHKAARLVSYYTIETQVHKELSYRVATDFLDEGCDAAREAIEKFKCKLRYFDIPIPRTTNEASQLGPPPPLTAQECAELETQIAAKYQEVLRGGDSRQMGRALEELLAVIFASIPGFTVSERNHHTATEEIDLVVRNTSADPFWRGIGSLILVEAKHWRAQRVGKNEYVQFYRKMENRGGHCMLGFLICTERFAETFEKEMLRDSKFPLRVAPIDGQDLQQLVEAQDRSETLRGFVERALLK
jgi:hypothetical protein